MGLSAEQINERLLVLAPLGRDAELIARLAQERGFTALACRDVAAFCDEFGVGVGAAVITEEALYLAGIPQLAKVVDEQPAWSDVPFIVLASRTDPEDRARKTVELARPLRNVTFIERPVRPATVASAFDVAIRDRRRQYVLRNVLEAHKSSEEALRQSEQQLRTALLAAGLGSWQIDIETGALECTPVCRSILGLPEEGPLTYNSVRARIHPDDLRKTDPVVQQAVDTLSEFQIEYRVPWKDGTDHWVLVRGKAFANPEGCPKMMAGVTMDITERRLALEAIEASESRYRLLNEELEKRVEQRTAELLAANKEMEGFTYSVSHDLRSPLRAIGSTSMIIKEDFGDLLPTEALEHLNRQALASTRLADLIDDLLKLSRITRQTMNRQKVDMTAVATEVVEELKEHDLPETISFKVQPDMVAEGDSTLIKLVLLNLLENAVKFSPNGGLIEVGSAGTDGDTVFFVRDRGIGFEAQYAHKIFLPFERLVTESDFPGTGIGLANVMRIVERHGGRVWVEPKKGKGTTFYFTLS